MSEVSAASSNHLRNVEALYSGHHGWLYARLCKKPANALDAADLAHDTFARILVSDVSVFDERIREAIRPAA